ncbi:MULTISPECIES: hypothetical protein [Acetobacter]|nr:MULTISPECIES: hypothetical protein [Acetobacter]
MKQTVRKERMGWVDAVPRRLKWPEALASILSARRHDNVGKIGRDCKT